MSLATSPTKAPPRRMTVEEFLAIPEDGVSRELIRGEVRERSMTVRNRSHSRIEANLARLLGVWLLERPIPRGEVACGEAGFRLPLDPSTLVGVDVAYAPELVAATPSKAVYYEGPPALAVEILSPSDTHESVVEKVQLYLEVGAVVWIVDPDFRTVSVHVQGQPTRTLNVLDELSGEPCLPGFRVAVSTIFG